MNVDKQDLKAQKKAERRSRLMTRMANRTFKKDPGVLDRLAMGMMTKAMGPAQPDDPDLDHSGPIVAFEDE